MQHLVQQLRDQQDTRWAEDDDRHEPAVLGWPALPEIMLAASACLILLLDVYGAHGSGGLTATLTMLALVAGVLVTNQYAMVANRSVLFDGLYIADPLAAFLKLAGFVAMAHGDVLFAGIPGPARHARRGVLRAVPDGAARDVRADFGQQPAHGVSGHGAAVAVAVRDGGLRPRIRDCGRGGDQVFRARRASPPASCYTACRCSMALTGTLDLDRSGDVMRPCRRRPR